MTITAPYLQISHFSLEQVIEFSESKPIPGNPSWMNLRFKRRAGLDNSQFTGLGIYAGFFDNQLIYIGKFLGQKSNPFAGNVIDARWTKHVGSLTLRGRNLSYSTRALDEIYQLSLPEALLDFLRTNRTLLSRDRGMNSTLNRFQFGAENWDIFKMLEMSTLQRFHFIYVRLTKGEHLDGMCHDTLRKVVSNVEDHQVANLRPRCNAVIKASMEDNQKTKLTPADVAKSIEDALIERMALFSSAEVPEEIRGQVTLPQDEPTIIAGPEPEVASSEALFMARIENDPNALNLIEGLRDHFDQVENIEIHFKKFDTPDLRVRAYDVNGKGRNVFSIQWQPRNKCFLCRSLSEPLHHDHAEFINVRETYRKEPLKTQFHLQVQEAQSANLISVVERAIRAHTQSY